MSPEWNFYGLDQNLEISVTSKSDILKVINEIIMESKSEQGVSSLFIYFFVGILQRLLHLWNLHLGDINLLFSYFLAHNILSICNLGWQL